jgi:exodeoxyribonuclease VII small subunit
MSKENTAYEVNIKRLEEIINRLEKGEIALEEGLSYFEEGIALVKKCQSQLDRAAQRVQVLQKGELVDLVDLNEKNGAD